MICFCELAGFMAFVVVPVVIVVVFSVEFFVGLGIVYNNDNSSGHFYSTVFYRQR